MQAARGAAALAKRCRATQIFAVANITPDSFSDGGWVERGTAAGTGTAGEATAAFLEREFARMAEQGAEVIDVWVRRREYRPGQLRGDPGGGGTTARPRPARRRPAARAAPGPLSDMCSFSIDTLNSATARLALDHGFRIVNDVSGGRHDPGILALVAAEPSVRYVMMYCKHATGRADLADDQVDVASKVVRFFDQQVPAALRAGVRREQLIIDPGQGAFVSMQPEDSAELMRRGSELRERYGVPVLLGPSRKGFLKALVSRDFGAGQRCGASLAAALFAVQCGADYIRVHDVLATRQLLDAHAWLLESSQRALPPLAPPAA
eukprot:TRINITY_DN35787_c0_g1_i2.p1 TRINITY_DN35787_c0_g1~~TRINITY_DN35787_c0_g1_i2.p1  ORF type:complete len:360 (+),score=87.43 TRINITY_DN35787_c0_g1_i2:117-1082(+)